MVMLFTLEATTRSRRWAGSTMDHAPFPSSSPPKLLKGLKVGRRKIGFDTNEGHGLPEVCPRSGRASAAGAP